MTPEEAKAYIQSRGVFGSVLGLDTIGAIMDELNHPERSIKCIHIAGTNGKGSTAHMISAVLTEAGYQTGLYTSPALESFNERFCLNEEPITDEDLAAATEKVKAAAEAVVEKGGAEATCFELETAIAFVYFWDKKVDFAVIEVGLGGRLDATNIIPGPKCAVITKIGMDHTEYLGDTLEDIAAEKAAIIKFGTGGVVMAPQSSEGVRQVIEKRAWDKGARIYDGEQYKLQLVKADLDGQLVTSRSLAYHPLGRFRINLLGRHQLENAGNALAALVALMEEKYVIPFEAIRQGINHVKLHGRFEILSKSPMVLIDGAHNLDGIQCFVDNLDDYFLKTDKPYRLNLYFGMLKDKDIDGCLKLLVPRAEKISTLTPDNERAVDAEAMAEKIKNEYGKDVTAFDSPEAALDTLDDADDVVNAFVGSLYMIGKVRTAFFNR
ncbi:MAG: bifunctional folylpolyglutamate synthase/dihydrofolate synthase [Eubacteriaceae bacterium]|uniref:tetrahydrofolate synthase n=1 Tax=Candidatus Pseudoramibacter fermentans TaxID=2594427 RepID=A0A6L5GQC0_9FIRM|nr:bifunctional folylpolyglutamate synthase/dihydrofolate synthase [Candidatus Pseudoramibacter fermentans]RRF92010.1 MAG: bifunctional folylpolyglutamate synthase/dihydrofolate synthase [Eubacteriaceae bacterium]